MSDLVEWSPGPLAGIRVIDLTSVVLGPLATQTLGDYGADIVKVEGLGGDHIRGLGLVRGADMSSIHMAVNRNKRSLSIDLRDPAGAAALRQLIATADVVVHNMRVEAMARLGFDYESVRAVNPNVIYCAATGFDQEGPDANRPAYDDIIQATSGLAALASLGRDDPTYFPTLMADKTTGLVVVNAILAALFHRERTGQGQEIEVPMLETLVAFVMIEHLSGETYPDSSAPVGDFRTMIFRRPYSTSDGAMAVVLRSANQWKAFLNAVDRADLAESLVATDALPPLERILELYELLTELVVKRSTAEWLEVFRGCDVPAAPVFSLDEVLHSEQLRAVDLLHVAQHPTEGPINFVRPTTKFAETPLSVRRLAPNLGEHSVEILREAGVDDDTIHSLLERGVVTQYLESVD